MQGSYQSDSGYRVFDPLLGDAAVVGGGNIDGAGTYVSIPTVLKGKQHTGYIVTVQDLSGSLAGTLTVEANYDTEDEFRLGTGQGWTQYTLIPSQAVSGSGTFNINISKLRAGRVRLKFVRSAGTGQITARVSVGG